MLFIKYLNKGLMNSRVSILAIDHYTIRAGRQSWDEVLDYLEETYTCYPWVADNPVSLVHCESAKGN